MSSYAEVLNTLNKIEGRARQIVQTDWKVMETKTAQLVAQANSQAAAARMTQFKAVAAALAGGPVPTAAALLGLATTVASTQASVNDAQSRQAALRSKGNADGSSVEALLNAIRAKISEFAVGQQTSQRFAEKSKQWEQIRASLTNLQAEVDQHATKAAWTSMGGSSALYEQRVPAQQAALGELAQVAQNSSTVSVGVATLQKAIYTANVGSMNAVLAKMSDASEPGVHADADRKVFFRHTLTTKASLTRLLQWMEMGSAAGWRYSSFNLVFDLASTLSSVTVLQDGWPGRTEDGPQGAQPGVPAQGGSVAEIDAHQYDLSQTSGQAGGVHSW